MSDPPSALAIARHRDARGQRKVCTDVRTCVIRTRRKIGDRDRQSARHGGADAVCHLPGHVLQREQLGRLIVAGIKQCDDDTAALEASPSAAPGMFTSANYGYALTLPVSWTSIQASSKWDGKTGLDIDAPQVDKFKSPSGEAIWAAATTWRRDLAAYTKFSIDWTNQFHGDICPAEPATRTAVY